jgi:hypothetical protein
MVGTQKVGREGGDAVTTLVTTEKDDPRESPASMVMSQDNEEPASNSDAGVMSGSSSSSSSSSCQLVVASVVLEAAAGAASGQKSFGGGDSIIRPLVDCEVVSRHVPETVAVVEDPRDNLEKELCSIACQNAVEGSMKRGKSLTGDVQPRSDVRVPPGKRFL